MALGRFGTARLFGTVLATCLFAQPACVAAQAPRSAEALQIGKPLTAQEDQKRLEELFSARKGDSNRDDYRVGPGDVLEIRVLGVDAVDGDYTVARDGTILVGLIGEVSVAGLTEERLGKLIAERLSEDYLVSPAVNVAVKRFRGRLVAVLGAVVKPAFYPIDDPGATIMDMINRAGGMRRSAAMTLYLSPGGATENRQLLAEVSLGSDPIEVDLTPLSEGKLVRALDLPVRSGDLLYVEEAGRVVVEGWVRVPRPVELRPGLSLVQAITAAGGLHFGASHHSLEVFRRGREGPGDTLRFDYEELASGSKPDVRLRAGDRIYVGASPIKASVWAVYNFVDSIVNVVVGGRIGLF